MLTASDIIQKYISFFQKRGHKRIPNSPLVPENDPTTLFTSSGMQPLVPYLLGELHPQGKRLVNVQNCFRAQDIDEVGDNRHTTFFRMLGNWSLGDYFKKEQLPWFYEFLTDKNEGLNLDLNKLYITVFEGVNGIPKDEESEKIWRDLFKNKGINPQGKIFYYGPSKNWWSRVGGNLDAMPIGEPGGPDSEVFYEFDIEHDSKFGESCHPNCQCGRFLEIGNSVFMQYKKSKDGGFEELPNRNVDFGGGLERLLMAVENQKDVFKTNLFLPIIRSIEVTTGKNYEDNKSQMRIIADHITAAIFMTYAGIVPSNKEQGYMLRRLIRRGLDNFIKLGGNDINHVIESIVGQYKDSDIYLVDRFEKIKLVILEEQGIYSNTLSKAKELIEKKYLFERVGDELMGLKKISSDDAFDLYQSHGLSPTQIKNLGFEFDEQEFAEKMKQHQQVSRAGVEKKFKGGLADASELTIKGHTATHLLHQAIRDLLGINVHQTGSNITTERVRFDFNFDRKLTADEIKKIESIVNEKINKSLPVYFKMLSLADAKKFGAIGLFDEKYEKTVKVYFVGGSDDSLGSAYSKEFCGGPHISNTSDIKKFRIIKEEGLGRGNRRIYAIVE